MSIATKFGLSLAALGAIGLGALLTPACSSSDSAGPQADSGTGSGSGSGSGGTSEGGTTSGYSGAAGQACTAPAGTIPNPECDDGDESTCAASTTCAIAASCGTTGTKSAPSCEPLAQNTGTTDNFRMRRIILVNPPKLANATVQNTVVTSGVDMLEPQCGEEGTGLFNWLLSFDTAGKTVTTGGAPQCDTTGSPACDPFTTGYCFVHKNVNGIQVGPVTAAITQGTDGTWSSTPGAIPTLNIPIYFGTPPSIILLPISNGALSGVKISADGQCIGSVNVDALTASCTDNYQNCSKWLTDGSLTGYITLKAANSVQVSLLSETLCTLLTGDSTGPTQAGANGSTIKTCAVDSSGNPTAKGDYCSTTNAAGGCEDSFWLAATFAASAVKINDGTGVADCTASGGGTSDDAGTGATDAGQGAD